MIYTPRNYDEYITADNKLWRSLAVVEEQIKDKSTKQRDNYYLNLGLDYIKNNFGKWIWLNVLKFIEFWSPMARLDMQGWKAFGHAAFRFADVFRYVFLY